MYLSFAVYLPPPVTEQQSARMQLDLSRELDTSTDLDDGVATLHRSGASGKHNPGWVPPVSSQTYQPGFDKPSTPAKKLVFVFCFVLFFFDIFFLIS